MSSHPLDPQPWPEWPVRGSQVRHEGLQDHLAEQGLLLRGEVLPVPLETRKRLKCRHQASAAPSPSKWANMSSADSCAVPRPAAISSSASRSDRKSTRLNSSHMSISYAVFCLKKKKNHV